MQSWQGPWRLYLAWHLPARASALTHSAPSCSLLSVPLSLHVPTGAFVLCCSAWNTEFLDYHVLIHCFIWIGETSNNWRGLPTHTTQDSHHNPRHQLIDFFFITCTSPLILSYYSTDTYLLFLCGLYLLCTKGCLNIGTKTICLLSGILYRH
jgi:hypothetical protein